MLEFTLQGIQELKKMNTKEAHYVLHTMYIEVTTLPWWIDHPEYQAQVIAAINK